MFHQAWWLDTVAPGTWQEVRVAPGDGATGSLVFDVRRRFGLPVSHQPPLTRTLGPVLRLKSGAPIADLRRRVRLTEGLIRQLPKLQAFRQTFDPRITDAIAFRLQGFVVHTAYTFRIAPGTAPDAVWRRMTDKTRNMIRRASEKLEVTEIEDPDEFCAFYQANLDAAGRRNLYGDGVTRRLMRAVVDRGAGYLLGGQQAGSGLAAAVAIVRDREWSYFLLSTRSAAAHSGAISLLLWQAIGRALENGRGFDLDGIASPSILHFLSGFGANLVPRLVVERSTPFWDGLRAARRMIRPASDTDPI